MSYPNTFTDLLEDDDVDSHGTREHHLRMGLAFLQEAENHMAKMIKEDAGSFSPPHSLAFANTHLLAAQVIAQVEG